MKKIYQFPIIDVKKYGGQQIAIVNGRIVAAGASLVDVMRKIQLHTPPVSSKEIRIFSVPKTLGVIYHA